MLMQTSLIKYDRSEEERMVSFDSDEKTYNLIKFRKPIKEQVSTCLS
jgi:hypothetical protein